MRKNDKAFLIFLKIIFKGPFVLWCAVSVIFFCIAPIEGLMVSFVGAIFAVPWALLGKWAVEECEESLKFNHRM